MDWFITDHLGSTKLLIDQNGQHRFTGDDDPFGINLRSFGDKDTHRFTGQVLDEEQGVYYYGARYYLPEIGRFLSGDPAQQFHNLFNYSGNNPILIKDPDGKNGQISVDPQASIIKIILPVILTSKDVSPSELKGILEDGWNNHGQGWSREVPKAGFFNDIAGRTSTFKVQFEAVVVSSADKGAVKDLQSKYGSAVNYDYISSNLAEHQQNRLKLGFSDWKSADSEVTSSRNQAVMANWNKQGASPFKQTMGS